MKPGKAITRLAQIPLLSPATTTGRDASLSCGPASVDSPFSHAMEELLNRSMDHLHIPGMAIAIVDGDNTYSRGYGIAKFPDIPVTPDTMFYGASTTKSFVTAALSLIVDDDETFPGIKWQTPISQIIPYDFVLEDDYSTLHLTLEDAATHRTGMPRHDFACQGGNQTVSEVVRSLRYLPLTEPLRTTFQYSNLMYVMLGYVIETLMGRWLGTVLAEMIWDPLNMTSTYFSLSDALESDKPFAQGYYWRTGNRTFTEVEYVDESSMEGCGAVVSSVSDYSKWIRVMINRAGPISEAGHTALTSPWILEGWNYIINSHAHYGYGWEIEMYRGYEIITHGGAETGFGTTVRYIPKKRWGCVMMANTHASSNVAHEILMWHLIDDLLDTPELERINLTAAVDQWLAEELQSRNITHVKELLYPPKKTKYIPSSLPIEAYAGMYTHPGYGDWPITHRNGTLWNTMNRTNVLQYEAKLDHITAEHFLLIAYDAGDPDDPMYIPVEFRIDDMGIAHQMGLELEESMRGEKIWFTRRYLSVHDRSQFETPNTYILYTIPT